MIENCDALRAFLRPGLKSLYFILLKRVIISDCRLIYNIALFFYFEIIYFLNREFFLYYLKKNNYFQINN